ncbi:uncharacterized protein LOC130945756 [Arachis stenosperma]|uniref:uncharacterized protein LOC130945756 n=1 Tax=Arachis stenosperma TaxID=217475 RepID=UPI0025AC9BCC|nr:uncharacterized protein LOC130945756 [Arachis stenosperma]
MGVVAILDPSYKLDGFEYKFARVCEDPNECTRKVERIKQACYELLHEYQKNTSNSSNMSVESTQELRVNIDKDDDVGYQLYTRQKKKEKGSFVKTEFDHILAWWKFLVFLAVRCGKKIGLGEVEVMENIANLQVYYNGEVIPNTHEEVTFVCECLLSFAIPCDMSFVELQNGFCNIIQSHILKRVSNLLYRSPVQVFGELIQFQLMPISDDASMQQMFCIYQQTQFHVPMIELYVEFEQQSALGAVGKEVNVDELGDIHWEEDNNNSEKEFEANYEVDDKNDDGDLAGNSKVQNEANAIVSQHLFGVPSFMRTLDLEAMHAPEFPKFANTGEGNVAAEDGEFSVRMEFGSRESVISANKSYTISRAVDYTVYESEPQTFYAKCKGYGDQRYNGKNTCTVGTISQDHAKLDSDTIADAIRPLVESDPSLKVKSVITEVQSRFNYTVSYHKALLAKQKDVVKVFGDWKVSY